jgi:hypothetical protein
VLLRVLSELVTEYILKTMSCENSAEVDAFFKHFEALTKVGWIKVSLEVSLMTFSLLGGELGEIEKIQW